MPRNSCATSTERSSALLLRVLLPRGAVCPAGMPCRLCQLRCRAMLVCFACRYFGLSFLLYYCLATPLLYKSYNFFNARGLWFLSTTQQNLWHTFFCSMVSSVCCQSLQAAELAHKFLSQVSQPGWSGLTPFPANGSTAGTCCIAEVPLAAIAGPGTAVSTAWSAQTHG